jgi:hypothetical protein
MRSLYRFLYLQLFALLCLWLFSRWHEITGESWAWVAMMVFDLLAFPVPMIVLMAALAVKWRVWMWYSEPYAMVSLYLLNVTTVLWRYDEFVNIYLLVSLVLFITIIVILTRYGILPKVR